jgi:hypothetical protein
VNRAYVDTTVLTDALLKRDPSAKTALDRYSWTGLPVYAIKEFSAGPLKNWIWFYNKLVNNSYSDALRELHRMGFTPKRYTTLTAIEALQQVAKEFESMVNVEVFTNYPGQTLGQTIRDQYLFHLKRRIAQSWRQRRTLTTEVVQELSCYPGRAPRFQAGGLIEKDHLGCDHGGECCLAAELRKRKPALEKILETLKKLPPKAENQRRIRILKDLLREKSRFILEDKHCRGLGDVVFAVFCPDDAVVLTTNIMDHEPLAAALGKKAEAVERIEA